MAKKSKGKRAEAPTEEEAGEDATPAEAEAKEPAADTG